MGLSSHCSDYSLIGINRRRAVVALPNGRSRWPEYISISGPASLVATAINKRAGILFNLSVTHNKNG
jgi:hypothetical protein